MYKNVNTIEVVGIFENQLVLNHENYGEKFYDGTIIVKRLSGTEDKLPVIVPGRIYGAASEVIGKCVRVTGQIRMHNKLVDGKYRTLVYIFAKSIKEEIEESSTTNSVKLAGALCKPPVYRTTPFGRTICDIIIAVNRENRVFDYIPCILWGKNADRAAKLKTSDKVEISGRFQSRCYEKFFEDGTSETRTTYEVSVFTLGKEGEA